MVLVVLVVVAQPRAVLVVLEHLAKAVMAERPRRERFTTAEAAEVAAVLPQLDLLVEQAADSVVVMVAMVEQEQPTLIQEVRLPMLEAAAAQEILVTQQAREGLAEQVAEATEQAATERQEDQPAQQIVVAAVAAIATQLEQVAQESSS